MFAFNMANEGYKEDFKNNMYHASYTAWQVNETIKGMLGGKSKSMPFNEYVKALGLDNDKKEQTKDQKQIQLEKQQALTLAKNIIQLDRKGRKK